ncbi:MBOAT family O-acyltransferase [Helicobacter sp. 11S02596-1]|uniref:MBOAT family O-acyltransferase n=1 Tax=Helicobacter sp. 11S02596-1 TaxID=1476194 RepID=UPI000BA7AE85|nr:MBOAT family O-acyltransferase [Helicobacter sp. 11S02596-1]PAF43585.1 hypothetical protein BJI48_04840 [Helicobacter sp. 11S02596-1]
MIFSSYVFIFAFLPIVLMGFWSLNVFKKHSLAKLFLTISSIFFYGFWNVNYIFLLGFSIIFNFIIGQKIIAYRLKSAGGGALSAKIYFLIGIVFNLGILGFFKYSDFFITNLNDVFGSHIGLLHILLPLGISFITFQKIAFLTDCYRGFVREIKISDFCLFVCFFPQLIAGPIVHHKEIITQFSQNAFRHFKTEIFSLGVYIFFIGLFKKSFLADSFAVWANAGFSAVHHQDTLNVLEAWVTMLSYTMQIYFDFSGYCDMAIGLALMFGISLPINFNSPYRALNIKEFWQCWHITLSRFLKDYLYIPMGGNKKLFGIRRDSIICGGVNSLIVFVLGGLWHGAAWGFVVWGLLHGLANIIHRIYAYFTKDYDFRQNIFYKAFCWLLLFGFINITWVFFRAENLSDATRLLSALFSSNIPIPASIIKFFHLPLNPEAAQLFPHFNVAPMLFALVMFFALAFFIIALPKNSMHYFVSKSFPFRARNAVLLGVACCLGLLMISPHQAFIYFNF